MVASTQRWERAQKAEKNYWVSTKKTWLVQNSREYGPEMFAHGFNFGQNYFTNKVVLEVGCGPNGIIHQLNDVKYTIGLDPMDLHEELIKGNRYAPIIRGLGERIPFQDNSFDVILSFNSIDHSFNPRKVMEEIYRVLRPQGNFLLWIYVLREKFNFLQPILNKVDPPHPYHLTYSEIIGLVKDCSFHITNSKLEKGIVLVNNTLKKIVGNYMMDTLWLLMVKES